MQATPEVTKDKLKRLIDRQVSSRADTDLIDSLEPITVQHNQNQPHPKPKPKTKPKPKPKPAPKKK